MLVSAHDRTLTLVMTLIGMQLHWPDSKIGLASLSQDPVNITVSVRATIIPTESKQTGRRLVFCFNMHDAMRKNGSAFLWVYTALLIESLTTV